MTTETLPGTTTVTTTWNEIEFTQTFGQPTTAPLPAQGTVGMGTLTGEIGFVKPTVTVIAGITHKIDKGYAIQTSGAITNRLRRFPFEGSMVLWKPPRMLSLTFVLLGALGYATFLTLSAQLEETRRANQAANIARAEFEWRRKHGIVAQWAGRSQNYQMSYEEYDEYYVSDEQKEVRKRIREVDREDEEARMMARMKERTDEMKHDGRHE